MEELPIIFEVFNEKFNEVKCNGDFFDLPTYWHADGVPYLIGKTKKGILIESHKDFPKKIIILGGLVKNEIQNLIFENFIKD
jgi:hypothetical protein